MQEMKLQELKNKTPVELLAFAETLEVENASAMRKQELMFAILKKLAAQTSKLSARASSRCCRMDLASCALLMPTTCRAQTIFIFHPRSCVVFSQDR